MGRHARLTVVLVLDLALVAGLVAVGLTARSLSVLAAGADYLADAAAVGVSLLAVSLAARPPTARRPQGHPKATTGAALVNAGWLLVLSAAVVVEAARRLLQRTPEVHGLPILVVSAVAAAAMAGGALLLRGDDESGQDLNLRAVLLDTLGDAVAAAGVAGVGAVILVTGRWFWLDPAAALAIAAVVGWHAAALVVEAAAAARR